MDKTLLDHRKRQLLSKSQKIRDFINGFIDGQSFVETDTFTFGKGGFFTDDSYGGGVVTGYAAIDSIPVCIFAQNMEVNRGGLSAAQAEKIIKIMRHAQNTGSVLIAVIDTQGINIGEGVTALEGYSKIISMANTLSGVIPIISVIKGECLGGMSYFAAVSDFVIIMKGSIACSNSPSIIAAASNEDIAAQQFCGAEVHYNNTGFASLLANDENDLSLYIKKILGFLYSDKFNPDTDFNYTAEELKKGYNSRIITEYVFDKGTFMEICGGYAPRIICGLAKLGGVSVGALICADDNEGVEIDSYFAKKAARFIRLLDKLNIPLISFVNCSGIQTSVSAEKSGIINDIASLFCALNAFQPPKISVICNKAVGMGYCAIASKSTGFDYCIAWNGATISPLPHAAMAVTLYSEQIKNSDNPQKTRQELIDRYSQIEQDTISAAEQGCIDNIIEPPLTRQYIISMLMMLWQEA